MIKSLAKSWLVPLWLYSSYGLWHPRQSTGTQCRHALPDWGLAAARWLWQYIYYGLLNHIIYMVFWRFITVTLDFRGSVWCAITLIPITKPAASNLMLHQAVPDQCLFKVQLQTLWSNLQTAGKFTQLLTFYRTVCYTKASAEFVLAIVNT